MHIHMCIHSAYAHLVASVKQMCTLIFNFCLTYTPAHAWCSTTPVNACILSAKMRMDSYIYIYIYIYTCTYICAYMRT